MLHIAKPNNSEYPVYFESYIQPIDSDNLLDLLAKSGQQCASFFQNIPVAKQEFRYADKKWTPKEILLHCIDAERIFMYRALRFSRNDPSNLSGFDENLFAPQSNANNRSMAHLLAEFQHVRASTIALFEGMTQEMCLRIGAANGNLVSVRALGFFVVGHEQHHVSVIQHRYL